MNSTDITSEESDFFHDFMDLEEFIDASTVTSMPELTKSPVTDNTPASSEIPDGHTKLETVTPLHGEHGFQGQQMSSNCVMGAQDIPNFIDPCHRQVVSSTGADLTLDTRNTSDSRDKSHTNLSQGGSVMKDKRYWDRRLKNNIAAKRSRDAKRLKETTIVERWTFLEEENKRLHEQILEMKKRLNAATGMQNNLAV